MRIVYSGCVAVELTGDLDRNSFQSGSKWDLDYHLPF